MKNKISNPETIQSIIKSINNGLGETLISKNLGIGKSPIRRIARENGLNKIIKNNNKKYKTKLEKDMSIFRHLEICKTLDGIYGNRVLDVVNNGGILNDVINIMTGVPQKQVLRFLEYKNIENVRKNNSKKYISNLAKINGSKSALVLTHKELKPITPEIVKRFMILKDTLLYRQKVYNAIKNEFGFGQKKIYQLCKKYGYPENNPQTGELNPMYGKSPGKNAGIGVKCWILHEGIQYFCRSSLELKVVCYFIDKKLPFYISKHRIPYIDDRGHNRTYCPDIVMYDKTNMTPHIYEIKPHMMTFLRNNKLKETAAIKYCEKFGMVYGRYITEKRLDLTKYDFQYMMSLINNKILIIDNMNLEKLKRNII